MKDIFVKHKNKALAITAGVLVAGVVGAQSFPVSSLPTASTVINCAVAGSCNIVVAAPEQPVQVAQQESFGAVKSRADEFTEWIAGRFTGELIVTGTSTLNTYVSSTQVALATGDGYVSSASSQTLCAIRNTGSQDRILTDVMLGYSTNTATGGGSQRFTISLSTTQGATGTGSNLLFDAANVTVPTDGLLSFTTTSTLQGTGAVRVIWRKGDWLNYLIASPTSTFSGDCRAVFIN